MKYVKDDFEFLPENTISGLFAAKITATINHRDGYSTVTRFEGGNISRQYQAKTTNYKQVRDMQYNTTVLPFGSGRKLDIEWADVKGGGN